MRLIALALLATGCTTTVETSNNAPPTVTFVRPAEGATFQAGEALDVCALVRDEVGPEEVDLVLSSDVDGELATSSDFDLCAGGNSGARVFLSDAGHTLTLEATDDAGNTGSDTVSVVSGANSAPGCTITAPADQATLEADTPVAFAATVEDAESSEEVLIAEWSSSLDGVLFTGAPLATGNIGFDATLSAGVHVLTLTVTDPGGQTGTCDATVTVGDACTDTDADADNQTECDGDCNDNDATIYEGATEIPGDGIDQDCDGNDTVLCYADTDNDGYGDDQDAGTEDADGVCDTGVDNNLDCDDSTDTISPDDTEIADDGIDQDCNGADTITCFEDVDNDGFGNSTNTVTSDDGDCDDDNESDVDTDCDDNDATLFPGQTWYADCDDDTYYNGTPVLSCTEPATDCDDTQTPDGGWTNDEPLTDLDCDDEDDTSLPGQTWYADCDDDGFYRGTPVASCGDPVSPCTDGAEPDGGWVQTAPTDADCDDEDDTLVPNTSWYADCDNDGDGVDTAIVSCEEPASPCTDGEAPDGGWISAGTDCNDENAEEFTGQAWFADCDGDGAASGSGVTQCATPLSPCTDGLTPDGGWLHAAPGEGDCDDEDLDLFPGQEWYPDCDGDTYYSGTGSTSCAEPASPCVDTMAPDGGWTNTEPTSDLDCDDEDSSSTPGQTYYADCDNDGVASGTPIGSCGVPETPCDDNQDPDGGFTTTAPSDGDCDDEDPDKFPGQTWYSDCDDDGQFADTSIDSCDEPVNPCLGGVPPTGGWAFTAGADCDDDDADEFDGQTWYADCDLDTYFNGTAVTQCEVPDTDCDDAAAPDGGWTNTDPAGNADCDDEDEIELPGQEWYPDCDGDAAFSDVGQTSCEEPATPCTDTQIPDGGYANVIGSDCDDEDDQVVSGTDFYADCDNDGEHSDSAVNACGAPTVAQSPCTDDEAPDGDYDSTAGSDCDDEDPIQVPGQTWYADCDDDGIARDTAITQCEEPATDCVDTQTPDGGWDNAAPGTGDCDDEDPAEFPGQTWYADCDGDTYHSGTPLTQCEEPATDCDDAQAPDDGWQNTDPAGDADCDDEESTVNPGVSESENARDDNCDDLCDEGFIAVGDLIVSEWMPNPSTTQDNEFIEVYNTKGTDILMCGGWVVDDDNTDSFDFTTDVLVPTGGYAVLARDESAYTTYAGTAPDYGYAGAMELSESGADQINLVFDSTVIDTVTWTSTDVTAGGSIQVDDNSLDSVSNDDLLNTCVPTATFGPGDFGTPGGANESCD